jgi:hypothetical protein
MAMAGAFPVLWWRRRQLWVVGYVVSVALGVVFYCWILKWQPWASRLHTPAFILGSPLLALLLVRGQFGLRRVCGVAAVLCMVLYAAPFALASGGRPLVPAEWMRKERLTLYFGKYDERRRSYISAVNALPADYSGELGLCVRTDDWEYPLWVLLDRRYGEEARVSVRHVGIQNLTRKLQSDTPLPEYVIGTEKAIDRWQARSTYQTTQKYERLVLLERK